MNSSIRQGDDDGKLYFFPDDGEEGFPLELIDGTKPVIAAAGRQHEITFLFGICPDQSTRTALYEWIENGILALVEDVFLEHKWSKGSNIITLLSEAEFSSKILVRKRKAP